MRYGVVSNCLSLMYIRMYVYLRRWVIEIISIGIVLDSQLTTLVTMILSSDVSKLPMYIRWKSSSIIPNIPQWYAWEKEVKDSPTRTISSKLRILCAFSESSTGVPDGN